MATATKSKSTPPEQAPERTLRADARRNREAVLAAAKTLFAEHGFETQMPDVAKAAKVGVGTVYRHFPTKEDLIVALADDRFLRLAERAREALEEDDAWEAFEGFMRFSAEIQAEDRCLCEVMGCASARGSPGRASRARAASRSGSAAPSY